MGIGSSNVSPQWNSNQFANSISACYSHFNIPDWQVGLEECFTFDTGLMSHFPNVTVSCCFCCIDPFNLVLKLLSYKLVFNMGFPVPRRGGLVSFRQREFSFVRK